MADHFQAILSVYDKTGVTDFGKTLVHHGFSLISSGGTAKVLRDAGVAVEEVSDLTGFPELLQGRVKTLHPKIHSSILAKTDVSSHMEDLKAHDIAPTHLVAVNLYPFLEKCSECLGLEDMLEYVDIGGSALIRAAAKNFPRVVVIVDPVDYKWVEERLANDKWSTAFSLQDRQRLAIKAFQHSAAYDAAVSRWLSSNLSSSQSQPMSPSYPEELPFAYKKVKDLKYGENPHQVAAVYQDPLFRNVTGGLAHAKQLHGPDMGFNNFIDAEAALRAIASFSEAGVSIVKHTNTCGLALHDDLVISYQRALAGDPVSAYGGIVATNRKVTLALAEAMKGVFFEVLVCAEIESEALERLRKRAKLRVLQVPVQTLEYFKSNRINPVSDVRVISGGLLVQSNDTTQPGDDCSNWKLVTDPKKPASDEQLRDLQFAWRVCKFVKSNAIVVCKNNAILGIGPGQPNRLQSIELALRKAGEDVVGSVLASDAFMPFGDNVEVAAAGGVTAIAQPGGSIRDEQSIEAANKAGIPMYFTGVRHFLH